MLGIVLTVVLVVAFLAVLPRWSHSRQWGYYPTGGIGAALLVVIVLLLLGFAAGVLNLMRAVGAVPPNTLDPPATKK